VRFQLLGPVTAEHDGRSITLGPRQQRFIFAVLALEVNRLVPLERLVELTWPDPPRTAGHAVQVCVSRLRALLAAAPDDGGTQPVRLDWGTSGYVLRVDPQVIDAHRFQTLLRQARSAPDDRDRVCLLDEALGLWRGPALAGTGSPETRASLACGLEEARLVAVEDRFDALLRLGRHREVLADLVSLVQTQPVRERLVGQLMLALHRCGRTGEALNVYRTARYGLAEELGLEPGAQLRRLEVALLRGDPRLDLPDATEDAFLVLGAAGLPAGASLVPGAAESPAGTIQAGVDEARAGEDGAGHGGGNVRPIRVALVDDHPIFRVGMRTALESGTEITVVAEAGSVAEAVAAVPATEPDVVVMDLRLPDGSGADATRLIVRDRPLCAVLVMSMSEDDEAIISALRSGARGYLLKHAGREETLAAVRAVARGGSVFSPQITARLASLHGPTSKRTARPDLIKQN
jgi:DNA-binding NarL/FixJ family response regulator/DNA-binding SARP family transcriptional activator